MIIVRLTLILLVLRTAKSQENDGLSNQASENGLENFSNTTMFNANVNDQANDELPVSLQTHEIPSVDIDMQPEQEGSAVEGITVEEDVNSAPMSNKTDFPTLEFEDEKGRIWYFRMPNESSCTANFKFMISNEFASALKIFIAIFRKELEEETREDLTAKFFLDPHTRGFQLIGRASCESLNATLSKVFRIFLRKETNATIFGNVSAELLAQEGIGASKFPLVLTVSYLSSIFEVTSEKHLLNPQELDMQKLEGLRSRLFHKLYIESFIAGNITLEEARELFLTINAQFDQIRESYMKPADVIVNRVIDLAENTHYLYEVNSPWINETAALFCFVLGYNERDLFFTEMLYLITQYFRIDSIPSEVTYNTYSPMFDSTKLFCLGLQGNHTYQYLNETFNQILDKLTINSDSNWIQKFSDVYYGLEDEMRGDVLETYWYQIEHSYYYFNFSDVALQHYKVLEALDFDSYLNVLRRGPPRVDILLSPPTLRGPQGEANDATGLPRRINDLAEFHHSSKLNSVWTPKIRLLFPY